jgi:hypothetical protein
MLAAVFIGLGGWCVVAPRSVVHLTVRPEYQLDRPLVLVTIGAFGAQAVLAGLFAAFSRFEARTFAVFGFAVLPFFVFDWWFYSVVPIFNAFILLDVAGNVLLLLSCVYGYRLSSNRLAPQ